MAIICGICLPVKILIVEYSENQEQNGEYLKIICWLFQLSQTGGFIIVDICLLLVTIGRYLFVYKTHVALAIRNNLKMKISIILSILLFTMSRAVIRWVWQIQVCVLRIYCVLNVIHVTFWLIDLKIYLLSKFTGG